RLFRGDGAAAASRARAARAVRGDLPLHPVDRDLLRFPLDLNRLEGLDSRGLLQLLEEPLRDQDLVRAGARAEAGRGVHGVSDHGVLQPAVRADVAGEHLSEVDPDPDAELGATLLLPFRIES